VDICPCVRVMSDCQEEIELWFSGLRLTMPAIKINLCVFVVVFGLCPTLYIKTLSP
jgi:hypothetical protein